MGTWPVKLGDQTFDALKFEGYNYADGYPDLMGKLVEESNALFTDYCTDKFCVEYGTFDFIVSPNKTYRAGMRLLFTSANTTTYQYGVTASPKFICLVVSYNSTSGVLKVKVEQITNRGISAKWTITVATDLNVQPYYTTARYIPVSSGGYGTEYVASSRAAVRIQESVYYAQEFFDDFISGNQPTKNQAGWTLADIDWTSSLSVATEASFAITGQARKLGAWKVTLATAGEVFTYSPLLPFRHLSSGVTTKFKASFNLGQLSTSTRNYTLKVGMIGSTSGVWLEYNYNVNAGKWQTKVGGNSSIATGNTATTVATGEQTIDIEVVGSNVVFMVNGSTIATVAIGTANSTNVSDLMCPVIDFRCSATFSSNAVLYLDYCQVICQTSR